MRIFTGPLKWVSQITLRSNFAGRQVCQSRTKSSSKDIVHTAQTEGKDVQVWPRKEPAPPMWKIECPKEPQPPNYDPYRIKIPNIVVPPLPPSNAKPMLDCTTRRGPCAVQHVPPPPPCLPPPAKPFPWWVMLPPFLFLVLMGGLYKMLLLKERWEKDIDARPIWRPRKKMKIPGFSSDLPDCVQYLIIGTGAAAWGAYQSIMKHDPTAKVLFLTKEDIYPYDRPPLSKALWLNKKPPYPTDLESMDYVYNGKKRSLYKMEPIHFMEITKFNRLKKGPAAAVASGWCVDRVDADDHVVWVQTLEGQKPIFYERCLLAPGE